MDLPTLESLYIAEHTENIYAQIIAEEDIGEDYGKKAIISERIHISRKIRDLLLLAGL